MGASRCQGVTEMPESLADLLAYPLLWRILLNSAVIAGLASWLGVQVLSRGIVFLGLAVAQGAVAGMAMGFWLVATLVWLREFPLNYPLVGSLLFVLGTVLALGSGRLHIMEGGEEGKVAILYITFLALAALFLVVNPRGEGRMLRIFYGNVLTIDATESVVLWAAASILVGVQIFRWKGFLWLSSDPLIAPAFGLAYRRYNLLFFLILGAGMVILLHFAGLVVPLALMIVPAFTAFHTATGMKRVMAVAIALAVLPVLGAVAAGVAFTPDYPLGTIIAVSTMGCSLLFYAAVKGFSLIGTGPVVGPTN